MYVFPNYFHYLLKYFIVPPYGQEDLQDLQSIFEVPHLKKNVLFLDTQCNLYFILM